MVHPKETEPFASLPYEIIVKIIEYLAAQSPPGYSTLSDGHIVRGLGWLSFSQTNRWTRYVSLNTPRLWAGDVFAFPSAPLISLYAERAGPATLDLDFDRLIRGASSVSFSSAIQWIFGSGGAVLFSRASRISCTTCRKTLFKALWKSAYVDDESIGRYLWDAVFHNGEYPNLASVTVCTITGSPLRIVNCSMSSLTDLTICSVKSDIRPAHAPLPPPHGQQAPFHIQYSRFMESCPPRLMDLPSLVGFIHATPSLRRLKLENIVFLDEVPPPIPNATSCSNIRDVWVVARDVNTIVLLRELLATSCPWTMETTLAHLYPVPPQIMPQVAARPCVTMLVSYQSAVMIIHGPEGYDGSRLRLDRDAHLSVDCDPSRLASSKLYEDCRSEFLVLRLVLNYRNAFRTVGYDLDSLTLDFPDVDGQTCPPFLLQVGRLLSVRLLNILNVHMLSPVTVAHLPCPSHLVVLINSSAENQALSYLSVAMVQWTHRSRCPAMLVIIGTRSSMGGLSTFQQQHQDLYVIDLRVMDGQADAEPEEIGRQFRQALKLVTANQ